MVHLRPEDELYRRVHAAAVASGGVVTSGAYKTAGEYDRSISVQIAKLLDAPEDALRTRPFHGLGVITVKDAEEVGFVVRPDPLPDDEAHALIIGDTTRAMAKQLAERTRLIIPPKPRT